MENNSKTISLVIPTHNRRSSLEQLLGILREQTFPLDKLEVVVVADGCTDSTEEFLKAFKAPYSFRYIVQPGSGAAIARNAGAATASGNILVFMDDDIFPSPGFLEAHAKGHSDDTVVIGYLPMKIPINADSFMRFQRSWWENKYFRMSDPGYRFSYDDLLSGNFSVSRNLFKRINGFDESLRCREDYEFGIRLINSGAKFIFSKAAWGYHHDTGNNLKRSFHRKVQEGKADIQVGMKHPEMIRVLPVFLLKNNYRYVRKLLFFSAFDAPGPSQLLARMVTPLLPLLERMKMRYTFNRVNYLLHYYWYLRGVSERIGSRKKLEAFFKFSTQPVEESMTINIRDGLKKAAEILDRERPSSIVLSYGDIILGRPAEKPGSEKYHGRHLESLITSQFMYPMMQNISLDSVSLNAKVELS